jgi:hypothetical protein
MSVGVNEKPTVVHGLEDRVRVRVRVRGDLDEMDVFDQPISEIGKSASIELFGKAFLDVLKATQDVDHRFRLPVVGEALAGKESFHTGRTLVDVEIE